MQVPIPAKTAPPAELLSDCPSAPESVAGDMLKRKDVIECERENNRLLREWFALP